MKREKPENIRKIQVTVMMGTKEKGKTERNRKEASEELERK